MADLADLADLSRDERDESMLTAGQVELLAALARGEGAIEPPSAWPAGGRPNTAALVRYLCGALPASEMGAVAHALARDGQARAHLREVRAALRPMQERPWGEAEALAEGMGEEAEIARAWLALAAEGVERARGARTWWGSRAWDEVRRMAEEGSPDARAAWTALRVFGEQLAASLRAPRVAFARGAEDAEASAPAAGLPDGLRLAASAATGADGSLLAEVRVVGPDEAQDAAVRDLDSRTVEIALSAAGEYWTVGAAALADGHAEITAPELGAALGLAPGDLPDALLRCRLLKGAEAPPEAAEGERLLLAEVVDPAGGPAASAARAPAEVRLTTLPRWQGGRLTLSIALPPGTRHPYATGRLLLDAAAAPDQWQRLGAWPVADWGDAPRLLSVACPGVPDGLADGIAWLRARIERGPTDV